MLARRATGSTSPRPSSSCCGSSCATPATGAVARQQILDRVWNYDFGGQANVVELYIAYLRKKIDAGPRAADPHGARRRLRDQISQVGQPVMAAQPAPRAGALRRFSLRRRITIGLVVLVVLVLVGAWITMPLPSEPFTCSRSIASWSAPLMG